MKRHFVLAAVMIVGTVGWAQAAPRATYRWIDPADRGKLWQPPNAATVSHVIFMNKCAGGCTLHPGNDNSLTDTSSIPSGTSSVSAYAGSAAQWTQLLTCVQNTYAPFGVTITDVRPTSGNYHEAIVAGTAAQVGEGQGVLGVSPFSCGYISNSISFTFANEEPSNIPDLCWTVAQETAHSWGLDHKFDNRDPMTYLQSGPTYKTFQDQAGSCGEYQARTCSCTYAVTGSAAENSYQLILATFGPGTPDVMAPTIAITSPANGASVMPAFKITATATDDRGVDKVELRVDGNLTTTGMAAPYNFNAPAMLSQGTHHIEVTAYDAAGNTAKSAIDVTNGTVCTDGGCTDPMQVCVDGHCVAGPGQMGGLGTPCMGNSDCASNQCGDDGAGNKYCVENCDPTKNECPSGFGCIATDTAGVCWPGADNGGGGCNSSGSGGVMFAGFALGAALLTRRRKRS
jgi:uncharacterized protein (TIGR03382 family)